MSFDAVISGDDGPALHELTVHEGSGADTRQIIDLDLITVEQNQGALDNVIQLTYITRPWMIQ